MLKTQRIGSYVGTFSKCMFPSLRVGYLIAPDWAKPALVLAKNCSDWHTSSVIQSATATFIGEGLLSSHVARMRAVYRQRRRTLLAALSARFAGTLEPIINSYGMHLSALGHARIDWERVAAKAQSEGINVHSLSRYYGGQPTAGLVFGVGTEAEDRLACAVERLASLV
jgi:GntR family transcriptional regulator/MocR family aminotransferase